MDFIWCWKKKMPLECATQTWKIVLVRCLLNREHGKVNIYELKSEAHAFFETCGHSNSLCVCKGCPFSTKTLPAMLVICSASGSTLSSHIICRMSFASIHVSSSKYSRWGESLSSKKIILLWSTQQFKGICDGPHVHLPIEVPDVFRWYSGPLHLQYMSGQLRQAVALAANQLLGWNLHVTHQAATGGALLCKCASPLQSTGITHQHENHGNKGINMNLMLLLPLVWACWPSAGGRP